MFKQTSSAAETADPVLISVISLAESATVTSYTDNLQENTKNVDNKTIQRQARIVSQYSKNEENKSQSGHKWAILVVVVLLTMTHFGLLFAFGTIFLPMLDTFMEDRAVTATVQSLLVGMSLSFGLVSGGFVSKFGVVKVTIAGSVLTPLGFFLSFFASSVLYLDVFIGIIAAIGISCIHVCNTVVLGITFSGPRKQMAISLQYTAISIAGMIYPYLFDWLYQEYGLRGTFLILAAVYMNSFAAVVLFYFDKNVAKSLKRDKTEHIQPLSSHSYEADQQCKTTHSLVPKVASRMFTFMSKILTPTYILVVIAMSLIISSLTGVAIAIIDIFVWKGFTIQDGLLSYIPYSICGLVARLLPGIVKIKKGFNSLVLPIAYCFCGVIGQLVLLFSSNVKVLLFGCGLNGISIGGIASSAAAIVVKIVDEKRLGVGFGLMNTAQGLMIAVVGPLYGILRDNSGSYRIVVLTTAVVQFTSMVLFATALYVRRRSNRQGACTPEI